MMDNNGGIITRRRAQILGNLAFVAGLSGAVSTVPFSSALQSLLLMVFVLAGVGSAAMCWVELPPAVTVAAVVGLSIASVVAAATSMAWLDMWYPIQSCLILSVVVAASGFARLKTLQRTATDAD